MQFLKTLLPTHLEEQEKFNTKHFTRKRIFTVEFLTFCLIYLISDQNGFGYKHIIQTLWKKLRELGLALVSDFGPSAAAFCKARVKLPAKIIKAMFDRVIGLLDQFKPEFQWHGRRLFAIDGMKVQLPASEELRDHFKCPQNQGGKAHYPQAVLSILFCVLTDVVYNFELAPYNGDERKLALLHLDHLRPADIIIMDRGYPAYEIFYECHKRQLDFVIRMTVNSSTWTVVKEFLRSGKKDAIVTIAMPAYLKARFKNNPQAPRSLTVRMLRIDLDSGETELLVTSLLDQKQFPHDEFKTLYHWRWPIEEGNKSAKHHQYIEKFHAQEVNGIFQEVNAHYLLMAITRLFMLQAEAQTPERVYGLSYKSAVDFVSEELVTLLLNKDDTILDTTINEMMHMMSYMYEKPRANRSYPRQRRSRNFNKYPVVKTG